MSWLAPINLFGKDSDKQSLPQARAPAPVKARYGGGLLSPVNPSEIPSNEGTCSTCCGFWLFLLFVPVSIVCFYHAAPTTILTLVIVWVMIALSPWAFHAGGVVSSDVSGPALTVTLFVSVSLAFLNGVRCYYEHSQPLRQLSLSREYKGVFPELPGVAFPDAAYIEFAGNTTVDTSLAVSYQSLDSGLSTFCAAPIVAAGTKYGRHDFWAIGVDCCGEKGEKFECYDAGNPDVKTGWVLPPKHGDKLWHTLGLYVSIAGQRHDLFAKAVQKAEAVHNIATPGKHAIFVRWTKDTKDTIVFWETINVVITIVFSAAWQTIMAFFMTKLYQRFLHVRELHRKQQKFAGDMANSEEEDMSARLQQFMSDALEGAKGSDMGDTIKNVQGALKGEGLEKYRPPLTASDMCLMGVLVPYLLLMASVIIATFSPCSRFGHLIWAPFWCVNMLFILALVFTPNRAVTGFFILICCMAGHYIGNVNYKDNMFHYCGTSDRRTYTNVQADANTDLYFDAGRLEFHNSAILSTQHSVGFLYQGTTYCAAPVISSTAPCLDMHDQHAHAAMGHHNESSLLQVNARHAWRREHREQKLSHTLVENEQVNARYLTSATTFMQQRSTRHQSHFALALSTRSHQRNAWARQHSSMGMGCERPSLKQVDFWATGTDCCDARGKFWCDGGEVKDAHEAVIVRAFDMREEEAEQLGRSEARDVLGDDRDHFFLAIDQAVAAYELPLPERPVLLRWGTSAKTLQSEWRKRAVGIIVMTGLASLLLILAVAITSFCFMRRQRRLEKKNMEDYERRAAGQGQEATVYDSPRNSLMPAQSADALRHQGGTKEDELRF